MTLEQAASSFLESLVIAGERHTRNYDENASALREMADGVPDAELPARLNSMCSKLVELTPGTHAVWPLFYDACTELAIPHKVADITLLSISFRHHIRNQRPTVALEIDANTRAVFAAVLLASMHDELRAGLATMAHDLECVSIDVDEGEPRARALIEAVLEEGDTVQLMEVHLGGGFLTTAVASGLSMMAIEELYISTMVDLCYRMAIGDLRPVRPSG